jgi:hypothetical protein
MLGGGRRRDHAGREGKVGFEEFIYEEENE